MDPNQPVQKHDVAPSQNLSHAKLSPYFDQPSPTATATATTFLPGLHVQLHAFDPILVRRVPRQREDVREVLDDGIGFGERFDEVGLRVQRVQ